MQFEFSLFSSALYCLLIHQMQIFSSAIKLSKEYVDFLQIII